MMISLAINQTLLVVTLIVMGIGCIVLGGYWMTKIDQFCQKGGFRPAFSREKSVMIYGENAMTAELAKDERLHDYAIQTRETPDPEVYSTVRVLVALGEKDIDNLLICRLASQANPEVITMAWCIDKRTETLYREARIDRIFDTLPTAARIRQCLEELSV